MVEKVLPEINFILCDMISRMFGLNDYTDNHAIQEVSLPLAEKYMVYIQLNSETAEGELIFSFNATAADHLLQSLNLIVQTESNQRKLLHSALGELANVVTGEIITHDVFKETFGDVHIQPPLVWDATAPTEGCIPLRAGFASQLKNGQDSIKTFVACSGSHTIEIHETDYTENEKVS